MHVTHIFGDPSKSNSLSHGLGYDCCSELQESSSSRRSMQESSSESSQSECSLILDLESLTKALNRIKKIRKKMLKRKQKSREDDETIRGLNEKNKRLTEKLKKIRKTQDSFKCIICFDSVSIQYL